MSEYEDTVVNRLTYCACTAETPHSVNIEQERLVKLLSVETVAELLHAPVWF